MLNRREFNEFLNGIGQRTSAKVVYAELKEAFYGALGHIQ